MSLPGVVMCEVSGNVQVVASACTALLLVQPWSHRRVKGERQEIITENNFFPYFQFKVLKTTATRQFVLNLNINGGIR
jgi:hypothetical protein